MFSSCIGRMRHRPAPLLSPGGIMRIEVFKALAAVAVLSWAAALPARADPVAQGAEHCVINVSPQDRLNIRAEANPSSQAMAEKPYGRCGIIVMGNCQGNWCPVEDGHVAGWVHRHFIAMVSPSRYCVTGVAPGDHLNLRAYPSPHSRVATRLHRNQCGIAFLPYRVGDWQKICASGWEGWVNRRYLSGQ